MKTCDMMLLYKAIAKYEDMGYQYIDVPYIVDEVVSASTKPWFADDLQHACDDVYSASGEQGFLQMIKDGTLPLEEGVEGMFCTLTPCYRDEVCDDTHNHIFMKVELIRVPVEAPRESLVDLLVDVKTCMNYLGLDTQIEVINELQSDLNCSTTGIEVGSYGIREFKGLPYVYGTGLAEPRASHCISKQQLY